MAKGVALPEKLNALLFWDTEALLRKFAPGSWSNAPTLEAIPRPDVELHTDIPITLV
jgi:hypothetical protein